MQYAFQFTFDVLSFPPRRAALVATKTALQRILGHHHHHHTSTRRGESGVWSIDSYGWLLSSRLPLQQETSVIMMGVLLQLMIFVRACGCEKKNSMENTDRKCQVGEGFYLSACWKAAHSIMDWSTDTLLRSSLLLIRTQVTSGR